MKSREEIQNIVFERVWKRVQALFISHLASHAVSLNNPARTQAFMQIVLKGDDFSYDVMNPLWDEFYEKFKSSGKMVDFMNEEIEKFISELTAEFN